MNEDEADLQNHLAYHYTSAEGHLGLLNDNAIWCTDLRFLNDAAELSFGLKSVLDALKSEATRLELEDNGQTPANMPPSGNTPFNQARRARQMARMLGQDLQLYVASFSRLADDLPQYRSYGPFAIGFQLKALSNIHFDVPELADRKILDLPSVPARVHDVVYGLPLSEIISQIVTSAGLPAGRRAYGHNLAIRAREIFLEAARYKHPSFTSEEEVRLIFCPLTIQGVKYRQGRFDVVPYVTATFDTDIVREVWIGPSSTPSVLNEVAIRRMLATLGYTKAEIRHTETPARLC